MPKSSTPGPTSDADFNALLRGARDGDERAWTALYGSVAPEVLGFLRGRRAVDPEDILGDAFLEIARRIRDFTGDQRGFRAWVFTITRARLIDDIRRRLRQPEDLVDAHTEYLGSHVGDVEQEALAVIELEGLLERLDALTDDQREVILLHALGGWTAREIGEITGRTTGAVEQLHHRALVTLRKFLTDP